MVKFSYFLQFVLIFFIVTSEAKCNSLDCDFNSDDCAWYTSDSLMPTWEWTGIQTSDDHGGYLQIPTKLTSDIDQWMLTSGSSQLNTSVHNLWYIPQSGCFTFSYRFHAAPNSKFSLILEQSFGEEQVLWDIAESQSIDWSEASVYIDSSNSAFRLHFTASIALKNSFGSRNDWIVSLDDFSFKNHGCLDSPQKARYLQVDETVSDIGETIYTSGSIDVEKLFCFSFTYFYTITNSKDVGSLLIMLETMSLDGEQSAVPRRILPIEKISLQRELSLNRNHFERTIVVDQKSFYTLSLVYAEKVHSSVVLVDDVSIKMERCSNESPKQDSDTTTVFPITETPPPTTTECCVTEPCICVQSTVISEIPTFNPSSETTSMTLTTNFTVPVSSSRIDQEISSTSTFLTEITTSETSTTEMTMSSTKEQLTTLTSLSSTQTTIHSFSTSETLQEDVTSFKSTLQSTSIDHIMSTTTDPSLEKTTFTTSTEDVITTPDQKNETFESSTIIILTTNYQNTESNLNTTQTSQVIIDTQTIGHDNKTDSFNAINYGNLGFNLITIFKFFFGERSLIASLSGLAGLSILMVSILILALNWKKQSEVRHRPVVISTANGELELNTYTFRRRTITLSRLEAMENSKQTLKFSKGADV